VDVDALLTAARQHGVVHRRQLIALGMSDAAVWRARRRGVLVDVLPGVLRVASSPETFPMRCMAAQLRVGGPGFLGAWTAGRIHGLRRMPRSVIHLTVPVHRRRIDTPDWLRLHRSSWFDADRDAVARDDGLVVATPLRMLFGLAAAFGQFRFERAAEDAWHLGLITPDAAADYLENHRCRGKDGVATMEAWLAQVPGRHRPAQSDLELELLDALARVGLPEPVRQHPLHLPTGETIHVDIAWPALRLAVEPGASWWHGGDLGQRRDQARDRACSELGWHVVRFDETLRANPLAAARQVSTIYVQRQRDLSPQPPDIA
jgi:hypothetical protein